MRLRRPALFLAGACLAASALAGEAAAGRQKATACAACHGPNGISVVPDAPNLAGQPALYIETQLKAYRDGARKHEVMTLMAKPLSDTDIDNLATWFSSLKIEVKGGT
ncbi:MAG: cytochrome c [Caldimonas sp.]